MALGVRAKGPLLAAPSVAAHGVMSLTPWATAPDVYFAKFVPDHIFLQNRDKINIKKFGVVSCVLLVSVIPVTWAVVCNVTKAHYFFQTNKRTDLIERCVRTNKKRTTRL
jgi:hypothetical protein